MGAPVNPRDEKCWSVAACQRESQVTLLKYLPAVEARADKVKAAVAGFTTMARILPAAGELAPNFFTSSIFNLTFAFLLCFGPMQARSVPQCNLFCSSRFSLLRVV